ncbi:rim9 protein [Rhodotorula toruloides]|uniref:Rim9 protein n=1 Tax=Rhodotorula toruloides TaxID=5286 RepID=A0A511KDQ0_RHOTO|nr:rim9 protein [Rhodotorula toruloides]
MILLVLVSVSVPLLKSIYFLKASISTSVGGTNISGTVTLGAWGYCVDGTCTSAKLGYSLDVAQLFGVNGKIAGISTSVLKWITYLLILHPIAAGFSVISVVLGLLAHMHGFAGTAFTTCFASFAATFSLLAFIFDIVVFVIAKSRIQSSAVGGSAQLGNAIWMTLAAMILLALSGFFFGCGACVIRRQRAGKEASEAYRPQPDADYGAKMRTEALAAAERDAWRRKNEGQLPQFAEREAIPLNSLDYNQEDEEPPAARYESRQFASSSDIAGQGVGTPSIITGVGEGYGRRNSSNGPIHGHGQGVSFAPEPTSYAAAGAAGVGAASRLAAEARANRGYASEGGVQADERRLNSTSSATTMPFTGMYGHEQPVGQAVSADYSHEGSGGYGASRLAGPRAPSASPAYDGAYPPYPQSTSPPPMQDISNASPPLPAATAFGSSSIPYPPEKPSYPYQNQQQPASPTYLQPPRQQYYVQNPSMTYEDPYVQPQTVQDTSSIAPTYRTHEPSGAGGLQYHSTGGAHDMYGVPRY